MAASEAYLLGMSTTASSKLVLFYKGFKTSKSISTDEENPTTIDSTEGRTTTAWIDSDIWTDTISWLETLASYTNAYVSLDSESYDEVTDPEELADTILGSINDNDYEGLLDATYEPINYSATVKIALDDIYDQFGNPMRWASVPLYPTSAGLKGQMAKDSNFLYICVAEDTWKRITLETITQEENAE